MAVSGHLVNPQLQNICQSLYLQYKSGSEKRAFIPASDPGMGGGAPPGGAPPGGDPAAMGGAPPPGGDPATMGGAPPPMDPSGGGGNPPVTMSQVHQAIQMAMGAGGAGNASGAAIKPKIDVNVEIMQMKNMLAKLCDALGVHIPAQDMSATPEKLLAMSQGQPTSADAGAAGGAPPPSAIQPPQPMDPMQAAAPGMGMGGKAAAEQGYAFSGNGQGSFGFDEHEDRADAMLQLFFAKQAS